LSSKITREWNEKPSIISKFGDRLSTYKLPLKDKIIQNVYRLKIQKKKIEELTVKMQRYDKELLDRCIKAKISHDKPRATMYANECAEVRKIAKLTLTSHLILEQTILRLETIQQFGDIASVISPIPQLIHTIKSKISGIMPEASCELMDICNELNDIIIQFGDISTPTNHQNNIEAKTILKEANIIANKEIDNNFPEIPIQTLEVERESYSLLRKGTKLES